MSGQLETSSKNTPIFEQATLGGAEILRGFRTDELIGRKLWSLQPEIWLPVFGINPSTKNQFAKLLKENLRIAAFFDVGGIYETSRNFSGLKGGPGIGLRFVKYPIIFKLDYAYGLGSIPFPRGGGKFYFGVETNLPF